MPDWQQRLERSLTSTSNQPESRFMQLATCDERGQPHNRTVVFRELDTSSLALLTVSDVRSDKCRHLMHNRAASVCWYFSQTREQYRFQSQGQVITVNQAPELLYRLWQSLSAQSRSQYYWGQPGSPLQEAMKVNSDATMAEHFCAIRFEVEAVDYLNLTSRPHIRERHRRTTQGHWAVEQVTP